MKRVAYLLASLTAILIGCQSFSPEAPDGLKATPGPTLLPPPAPEAAPVVVPAGSHNALAAAIAAAGPNGHVRVASGNHTEEASVLIMAPVTILGEPGAVIEFATNANPIDANPEDADFHVKQTSNVRIEGLTLRAPAGHLSGIAVLLDHSNNCRVIGNNVSGHQHGVLVLQSDFARVQDNTFDVITQWQTGEVLSAFGVVVISGAKAQVLRNTVTNGLFGIWCCDTAGLCAENQTSGCFVGLILCTVPAAGFNVDGVIYGADFPCNHWLVRDNVGSKNFTVGLLVIDNANNNRIVNNTGSGNGTYDIEMTADTFRFGFLTPASHDNQLITGNHPNLIVKDCGNNNTITGTATIVDNNLDPCN